VAVRGTGSARERREWPTGPVGGRRLESIKRVSSWWTARGSGSGSLVTCSGCRVRSEGATGGASELAHWACVGSTTPAWATRSGHRATSRGGDAGSSWRRNTKCVATQGRRCRQRLFGVAVDDGASKLGRRSEGMREAGRGGRQGESPKLGSGAFQRVLVTTSRLQRLVRGIFSLVGGGASCVVGGGRVAGCDGPSP
jgi:hypothetical protein